MGKDFFPFLSVPGCMSQIYPKIGYKKEYQEGIMRFSRGDVVEFKVGSNETHKGQVQFVEEDYNENILYVNSFGGWAYKVPEKRIVSRITGKN